MKAAALEARALACTIGHRRLFASLGFRVDAGRWLMLTGPNGTGKSTLLRILAGLSVPDGGDILWAGASRKRGDPAWHADFLYQGHASGWKDLLSARENLALQAWLDIPGLSARARDEAVDRAIARVGLGRQRQLAVARLSAGQRRRLGLARLAMAPRALWLLDEPTTALDTDGQALFADLLDDHLGAGGIAVIATHLDFPTRSPAIPLALGA